MELVQATTHNQPGPAKVTIADVAQALRVVLEVLTPHVNIIWKSSWLRLYDPVS